MILIRIKWVLIISLVIMVWSGNGFSDSQLLFQPPAAAPQILMPFAHPLLVVRQAAVVVDLDVLQEGRAEKVVLNLFRDVVLTAEQTGSECSDGQGYCWSGNVIDIAGSQVVLVVSQERLSGMIRLPERMFKVWPLEDGLYVVREIQVKRNGASIVSGAAIEAGSASPLVQEQEVLRLVNEEREQAGLHALVWNDALFNAARDHSLDMATNNYFSHESLDGRSHTQRMTDAGYDGIPFGENIAYGYDTPTQVMVGWMGSAGHRENILRESHCDLGVGVANHANTNNRLYWTQDFGIRSWEGNCPEVSSNQLPVARFVAQPVSGLAPLHVNLDASASDDPDGQVVGYHWDFGDGFSGSGIRVQHTYSAAGHYTVRLTVVDDDNAVVTQTATDLIAVGDGADGGSDEAPGNDSGISSGSDGVGGGCFIVMAQ